MAKNLLVELGLEELPAYVVTPSEKQLGNRMAAFLNEKRLAFEGIQTFSTPRRLAVRVSGLADAQTDLTEDFKGPSKKIALDADGNFTKAAQGFVRGKGLTTDDIEFREVKGEEYVYVTKHEAGKAAKEVFRDACSHGRLCGLGNPLCGGTSPSSGSVFFQRRQKGPEADPELLSFWRRLHQRHHHSSRHQCHALRRRG